MKDKLRLPQWNAVLLAIYRSQESQRYCQRLSRKVRGSLTHLRNIVKRLASHDLVRIVPQQKIKFINLTRKGEQVASSIMRIKSVLS